MPCVYGGVVVDGGFLLLVFVAPLFLLVMLSVFLISYCLLVLVYLCVMELV